MARFASIMLQDGRRVDLEVIDLLRCSASQRGAARSSLIEVQSAVYRPRPGTVPGAGARTIKTYVDTATDIERNAIYNRLIRAWCGPRVIGAVHAYSGMRTIHGEPVELMQSNLNVLPAFNGIGLLRRAGPYIAYSYAARRLLCRHARYVTATMMTPVSYRFLARRCRHIHPGLGASDSRARAVHAVLFDGQALVDRGLAGQLAPTTAAWVDQSTDPHIQRFLDLNPRWREGFGLPIIARMEVSDMLWSLQRTARLALR